MKRNLQTYALVIFLIIFSVLIYFYQITIFHRPDDTMFYLLQDMAFLPISVLLVTLGMNTVLNRREHQAKLNRVSVVINEFYAETGIELIQAFRSSIVNLNDITMRLELKAGWQDQDFSKLNHFLNQYPLKADIQTDDLLNLKQVLIKRKDDLLRLFENANLVEHDRFTELLWALYHVYDELHSRESLTELPPSDIQHLNLDIQRAFQKLLIEWVESMRSLQKTYPYLYSLAIRKGLFGQRNIIV